MKIHDPIRNQLHVYLERIAVFVFLSLLVFILIWLSVLYMFYRLQTPSDIWEITSIALNKQNIGCAALMRVIGALSISIITNFYLIIALWWKRSGEAHYRGSRFEGKE